MQWIEIIHLRTFSKVSKKNAIQQVQELADGCRPENLTEIVLWIRSDLDSDICLLLCWRKPTSYRAYSQVGLQLAEDLSHFGWVNHSLWQNAGHKTV